MTWALWLDADRCDDDFLRPRAYRKGIGVAYQNSAFRETDSMVVMAKAMDAFDAKFQDLSL
jgi:hypothetical protein